MKLSIGIAVIVAGVAALFTFFLQKSPVEQAILKEISHEQIVGGYQRFLSEVESSQSNFQCTQEFLAQRLSSLKLREAAISLYYFGPAMELRLKREINFRPIRPSKINAFIAGELRPLKDESVTIKGLSNLEYVFAQSGVSLEKKCEYFKLALEDMGPRISEVLKAWNTGYAQKFSQEFNKKQSSVHILINQALKESNELEVNYLAIPFGKRLSNYVDKTALPDHRLGLSGDVFRERLSSVESLFYCNKDCHRIGILLKEPLRERLLKQFNQAKGTARQIASFEKATEGDSSSQSLVEKLYRELQSINRTLSTELVTQLGVTVTFTDNDGD